MELRYLKYSIEELADDKRFFAWILNGEKDQEWKIFIEKNPEFRIKVKRAREIVLSLRDTSNILDEREVLKMWQNIERFDHSHKRKTQTLKIRRSLYWAASFFLILCIGALSYVYFGARDSGYQFTYSDIINHNNEARLVLSNGEQIALKTNNSKILLKNDNKLVINNDSVIDLSKLEVRSGKRVQMNELVIPFGEKSVLYLSDGTKVWLNAGTRFAFPSRFTGENREVFLQGEAYFEVAKNKKQPFIVSAGQINIKVLGTHFNVSAYANDASIETILLEGSVAVRRQTSLGLRWNEVVLKPYQKASFDMQNNEVKVSYEPGADQYITWTEGWLQFSQESLQVVFAKLERYYNVDIKIPGNFNYTQLISGKLDLKKSLGEVMNALDDVAKFEYRMNGDTIYIEQN